jgi:glutamate---cysteine ligase / carboxylate-amine ligase
MTFPTLGVEEEFLLVDPFTGVQRPVAAGVIGLLAEPLASRAHLEFRPSMVELVTPVCTEVSELLDHLGQARQAAGRAATAAGAALMASGMSPTPDPVLDPVQDVPDNRLSRETADHAAVALEPAVCGCHVHVAVPDRDTGVQVCGHLRAWLPVVQAIAVNSPIHAGRDIGHASCRSLQLERWPSIGPTPTFTSAAQYDDTVAALSETGTVPDRSRIYWYARLSENHPTVEIRVTDVCATAAETALIAALLRALVVTTLEDIAAGRPPIAVPDHLLHAAHWRAAHDGLEGLLIDPPTGQTCPAWDVAARLMAKVTPALQRLGDATLVASALHQLHSGGSGAARQRRVLQMTGSVTAVVKNLIVKTRGPRVPVPARAGVREERAVS